RLDPARLQVGGDALYHVAEVLLGNPEAPDGVVKRRPQRMCAEAAFERILHLGAPLVDGGAAGAGFVAEVVTITHERINRAHGPPLLGRKEEERVIEIFGAGARDVTAILMRPRQVFGHAAREKATRAREPS